MFCSHQIVVSQSVPLKQRHHIYLTVVLYLLRCDPFNCVQEKSKCIYEFCYVAALYSWYHFLCDKLYILIQVSLLVLFIPLLFPTVCLKISSIPTFIKNYQNFQVVLREMIKYMLLVIIKAVLCTITFILSWYMHIQNNIIQTTSQYYMTSEY